MLYRYFRDEKHANTFNKGILRFYEINKYIETTNDSIADKNESALINATAIFNSHTLSDVTIHADERHVKETFCLSLTTSDVSVIEGSNYRGEITEDYIRLLQDILQPYKRLECNQVSYYNPNNPNELPEPVSVANYRNHVLFYKENKYKNEEEYRVLFFAWRC